jgi:hypothetical protein
VISMSCPHYNSGLSALSIVTRLFLRPDFSIKATRVRARETRRLDPARLLRLGVSLDDALDFGDIGQVFAVRLFGVAGCMQRENVFVAIVVRDPKRRVMVKTHAGAFVRYWLFANAANAVFTVPNSYLAGFGHRAARRFLDLLRFEALGKRHHWQIPMLGRSQSNRPFLILTG